jgi:carboxypeptidase PM20D1
MMFLYIALGIIGLVILITLFRFLLIKKTYHQNANNVDDKKAIEYAEKLSKMIQIKTLSYEEKKDNSQAFIQLKDLMNDMFPRVFKTMEKKTFKGQEILLHWKGKKNDKPLVLMSHLDVVDVLEDAWTEKPFAGSIKDKQIFGRGSLDTKSTVFAFYQACEILLEENYIPEQDVYLFSSTNEETSGPGASYAVDYLKEKGIKPFLVVDEGGAIVTGALPTVKQPLAMVGIIEKGYANIEFTAKSNGGHSSTPPKNTPIARLSAFVNDVEKNFPLKTKMIPEVRAIFETAAPYMKGALRYLFVNLWLFKPLLVWLLPKINPYGRALLSTTIAFTMSKASDEANVIPSQASLTANLRTHPIQNVEDSFNALKKRAAKYDIDAKLLDHREASPMTKVDSKAYAYLESMIKRTFPDVVVSPYVMLGGTDCRFFNQISDGALRFSPIRMHQSELSKMHGADESIRISTLVEAVDFYSNIIKNNQ